MYHKQLVTHVSARLHAGMDEQAIRNELTADGWTKDDIEEAFLYARSPDKLRHFSLARKDSENLVEYAICEELFQIVSL